MKRLIVALLCFFASLAIFIPVLADDDHRDYDGRRGYREHPYGHRHYGEYRSGGHRFIYRGHWRSWDDWDRYRRAHPRIYKYGRYYREGGHLLFRFCEPGINNCFFFSIGR
jgi:hypothetical protein